MKFGDTQKYGLFLEGLSTEQIDKLMSNLLKEMRRRDLEHVKSDVLTNTKALTELRVQIERTFGGQF